MSNKLRKKTIETLIDLLDSGLIELLTEVLHDSRVTLSENELGLNDVERKGYLDVVPISITISNVSGTFTSFERRLLNSSCNIVQPTLWSSAHYTLMFIMSSIPNIPAPTSFDQFAKPLQHALEAQLGSFWRQAPIFDKKVQNVDMVVIRIVTMKTLNKVIDVDAAPHCSQFATYVVY